METRPIVLYNSWPDSVGSSPCKCSVCWAKFQAAQFFPHVCVCVCVCVCTNAVYRLLLILVRSDNCSTNECNQCVFKVCDVLLFPFRCI